MNSQAQSSVESTIRYSKFRATRWAALLVLVGGCSAGQLERVDNAPLTEELAEQYNTEANEPSAGPPPPVYTRYDLGKMSVVNLGTVIDASIVQLHGTTDTGWKVGTAAGGLNAINS